VDIARSALAARSRLLFLTGAGLSTAAGISDYRGPEGIWTKDPAAERASRAEVYASDPEVRHAAWGRLLARLDDPPRPTRAHETLVELEGTGRLLGVVTQNVDGLHRVAGTDAERLIEIHGTLAQVRCLRCGRRQATGAVLARVHGGESDPHCDAVTFVGPCDGILSADIVRFGEPLDPAKAALARAWVTEADALVAVGTSLTVYPVAGLVHDALARGTPVVIVNAQATPFDDAATVVVHDDVQRALPAMLG
jgi:NAD-dependent deacetylase